MSEKDSDKTKLRQSGMDKTKQQDATRIAPKNGVDAKTNDDRTRIAPAKSHATNSTANTDDKTRLATPKKKPVSNDVTQFNPKVTPPHDKTRIAPTKPLTDSPVKVPASKAAIEVSEHGILKDRFVLEQVLGAGGMGIVYKAKDLLKVEAQDRDPYVAIKVLSDEFKSHPEAFISLQRESRKSQRIAHPNIVNVYDFDRDDDTVFMTMEFLDGAPLDQLIRQYKSTGLPTDDAWQIIEGMSAALSHAHAEKIIHSDFKPGNVFITKKGLAKVFDFGIARAVAKAEHFDDNPEDKTVFDAGSLGALTPAYASLEMLEGEEPDIRDDVFALGCVAYEMLTGSHPYNKIPANEAEKQGLKPKRITEIKKYQWRAIEKAIAFRRENRTESVDQFIHDISPKIKSANRFVTALALLLSVAITSYFLFLQDNKVDPFSEFDIRTELELKIRIDFYKENLDALLQKPSFEVAWQDEVWKDISDLTKLTQGEDPWVDEKKQVVYKLYLGEISSAITAYKLTYAKSLLVAARRYTENFSELKLQENALAEAFERNKLRKARDEKRQQQKLLALQKNNQQKTLQKLEKRQEVEVFDLALSNVNTQLKCQGRLNMRNIDTAIRKLKQLDPVRYGKLEGNLINALADCIVQMGKAFPDRALEAKKHSLRIFKNNAVLLNAEITPRDPCDVSLAGLGARGKRAICKDKIKGMGTGPDLVVIPGNSKISAFAIGKYEVSVAEINLFCKNSKKCTVISDRNSELPASDLTLELAKNYLRWLSKESDQKYRLPTKNEWLYAAKARRKNLDANRNCKLSTRGIEKGEQLVKTGIGKQNSWGIVNYVGNVQEWAYDNGRKLVAVGGSFKQSMENCDITTTNQHSGVADKATGFRVLRELRVRS